MNHLRIIYSKHRKLFLLLLDLITISISFLFAFFLRFDFSIPSEFGHLFYAWLPPFIVIQMVIFHFARLYQIIWRFTSLWELLNIIKYVSISFACDLLGILVFSGFTAYPRSVLIIFYFLNVITICVTRVSVRIYYTHFKDKPTFGTKQPKKKLILIGAGKTGEKIAREIANTPDSPFEIVGFVDDDHIKKDAQLHGYRVLGTTAELRNLSVPFDELLITAPSASGEKLRNILEHCKLTGKRYKTVPSLTELIDVTLDVVRDVSYVDLLGREEANLDMNSIEEMLRGKRVLISGAGGSIGFELVKQCLNFQPSELVCLDICEEKIFDLTNQTGKTIYRTIIKPVLVSILEKKQLEKVFNENRPQIIFHAAAYKHVPIQEVHPWIAVDTNVGGTLNMVDMSHKYGAEKFVLVSTDKAVNPINIMGATKRLAEKLTQSINTDSKTQFMAVRFGNVLGSSGSAIPTFEKQITAGGPVTVTHPEMTRYFMSIQEASQLILQSGALGKDGEIFLLEMGKPIKIVNMVRDLIKLSGLEPDVDIPIVYVGLRPGEKLYEELQSLGENKIKTEHTKIMILKDGNHHMSWIAMKAAIMDLLHVSRELNGDRIQTHLKALLPTYQPRAFIPPLSKGPQSEPYAIKGEA